MWKSFVMWLKPTDDLRSFGKFVIVQNVLKKTLNSNFHNSEKAFGLD